MTILISSPVTAAAAETVAVRSGGQRPRNISAAAATAATVAAAAAVAVRSGGPR